MVGCWLTNHCFFLGSDSSDSEESQTLSAVESSCSGGEDLDALDGAMLQVDVHASSAADPLMLSVAESSCSDGKDMGALGDTVDEPSQGDVPALGEFCLISQWGFDC